MKTPVTLPVSWPSDPEVTRPLVSEHGLTEGEWDHLRASLQRKPTFAELGVISVMWSEHCSYKSSRVHLKRLPTEGEAVVLGPGENAGAVDIGDGFCAVFKMESHNHPSYIEPYQGAATGVGGILRDVFTMGARPVALLNSLRFGKPDHPKTAELLRGVVAGIGGYGNCMGVPTVGGEVQFDESYNGNNLVNAFALGIAETNKLFFGRAVGDGNPVLYVGARTGRDGIHGATMASAQFDETAETKLPTVQVGDPFKEKLLLEACLEIFKTNCIAGVQDMGAAGLTSSAVEMAARAGTGLELDLDSVPRRALGLTPYEMLLSESQERMLMVANKGREAEIIAICEKWDLEVAVIGNVTESGRFVCRATPGYDPLAEEPVPRNSQVVVDLPLMLLTDAAPIYTRPERQPIWKAPEPIPAFSKDLNEELLTLVGSHNIGSRRWIWTQYDHVVRNGTIVRPGAADAALIRVFCERDGEMLHKYLALSVDCNGRHVKLDPFMGAAMAVAECARNVVCIGAKPLGLTDCLNFGNPESAETMWHFSRAIDGIAAACTALQIPVVSGNVSLYNETDGKPILPTPVVAVVGQLKDPDKRITAAFGQEGDMVAQLGPLGRGNLSGSEWLVRTTGRVEGEPLSIDLMIEARVQDALFWMIDHKLITSAHDVSDGGLSVALAESCLMGGKGAHIVLPEALNARALFSEEPSRILIGLNKDSKAEVLACARRFDVPLTWLGHVQGERLQVGPFIDVPISALADAHEKALESMVGCSPSGA
ncbi:MAG: phosphoribosylformylglycinamidine synthase subunit PurL [Myxococcales bacterium]|nr:phosphoribosylformylglycinamidine synthase subunit PurL [Myxococcales bacterium]MCB9707992.1 phosphoribosylformylglycinamidine synthase subunit PurL [Myxococcales bacterium]